MSDQQILAEFREKILAPFVKQLAHRKESLRSVGPERFGRVINGLAQRIFHRLFSRFRIRSLEELEPETQANIFIYTCSDLNAVLPLDYPYAAAILDLEEEEQLGFYMVIRKRVPGWRDLLYSDTVFRVRYRNQRAFFEGKDAELSIKCMHEDPDDLPPDPAP